MSAKFRVVIAAATSIALLSLEAPGQSTSDPSALSPGPATPVPLEPDAAADHGRPQPIPIIDKCQCSATTFVRLPGGGVTSQLETVMVTDVANPTVPPRDTCPAASVIEIAWHSESPGVTGWRYRFDQGDFVFVPPSVRSLTGNDTVPLPAGTHVFTLGARDPGGVYRDTTRRFQLNFSPDTWWSGPDPSSPALSIKPNGERYARLIDGQLAAPITGSLMSPESTITLPAARPERRTFFEIWKDSVFVRGEGDTVHMNSWVVFHAGGFDCDSPYAVHVTDLARQLPEFPGGPVLDPGPANGSPVAFRSQVVTSLTPTGQPSIPAISTAFPVFDPNSVFHTPRIAAYHPVLRAGRAFATLWAIDGDNTQDRRVSNPRDLVLRIENGTATPYELSLRSKVVTFEVDRAPYFRTNDPLFRPTPSQTFTTSQWNLALLAADDDPFVPGQAPPGGPSVVTTLRRQITVRGKDPEGHDLTYVDPVAYVNQSSISITVPDNLAAGPCTIDVELCDCDQCEYLAGSGRCVVRSFAVNYQPASAPPAVAGVGLERPATTRLLTPYPNPASGAVTLRIDLATAGKIEVEVFNLAGQRVRRLASEVRPAGHHDWSWDGRDDGGRALPAGVYLARLSTPEGTQSRKVFMTR